MKDLHIHTVYSDGELAISEIIEKIKKSKIDFFSITDHNNFDGCKEIIENNLHKKDNLKFVTGIELSAAIDKGNCHILGYNIDLYNEDLIAYLKNLKEMDNHNIMLIIDYLINIFKLKFSEQDIENLFIKKGSINNVEVAKLLIKFGYCHEVGEAFQKYILPAKKATNLKKREFSVYNCIDIIKKAGGIPVLAHNYQLKKNYIELKEYICDLKNHGLMGLECYHSGFSKEGIDNSLNLAKKYDLLITGGSDYHGKTIKPDIEIGTGKNNNLDIKELSIEKYLNKKLRY